jgi:hypothetical protein
MNINEANAIRNIAELLHHKNRIEKLEAALIELLRLYDWRNEKGAAITHAEAVQYGQEKKRAWEVAREVLKQ